MKDLTPSSSSSTNTAPRRYLPLHPKAQNQASCTSIKTLLTVERSSLKTFSLLSFNLVFLTFKLFECKWWQRLSAGFFWWRQRWGKAVYTLSLFVRYKNNWIYALDICNARWYLPSFAFTEFKNNAQNGNSNLTHHSSNATLTCDQTKKPDRKLTQLRLVTRSLSYVLME